VDGIDLVGIGSDWRGYEAIRRMFLVYIFEQVEPGLQDGRNVVDEPSEEAHDGRKECPTSGHARTSWRIFRGETYSNCYLMVMLGNLKKRYVAEVGVVLRLVR
jgi:hypothetical protein